MLQTEIFNINRDRHIGGMRAQANVIRRSGRRFIYFVLTNFPDIDPPEPPETPDRLERHAPFCYVCRSRQCTFRWEK